MTSPSSQEFESYVPVYDTVPERWEDARQFLVEHLKKISNAVNIREIGWLLDEELLSGKAFIPALPAPGNNPGVFRQVLRKVIDFGPLPAAGTKSVLHGILFDARFTLIQLWASATDPVALVAIPIPFVSTPGEIQINMTSTMINITVSSDRHTFTRCFVFIEYIQEI